VLPGGKDVPTRRIVPAGSGVGVGVGAGVAGACGFAELPPQLMNARAAHATSAMPVAAVLAMITSEAATPNFVWLDGRGQPLSR